MIIDTLNLQKNTLELLEEGCQLLLETSKKKLKLRVELVKENEN